MSNKKQVVEDSNLHDHSNKRNVMQYIPSNIDGYQRTHHVHHNHHKHASNCKHKQHKKCNHSGPKEHCNHGMEQHKELTPKEHKQRTRRRLIRQWGRRGNHVLQNIIAAIWVWSLSESSLRYYYDNHIYDKILIFHGLQVLSLVLFFYSSLTEPGFLESNSIPKHTNQQLKKHDDEIDTLLPNDNTDIESDAIIKIDPNNDAPPSLCRTYVSFIYHLYAYNINLNIAAKYFAQFDI
eukprot:491831_1